MSIWSTFACFEPLRDGYDALELIGDSALELADTGLRGPRGTLLRIVVDEGEHDCRVALDRWQVTELRDELTMWLDRYTDTEDDE